MDDTFLQNAERFIRARRNGAKPRPTMAEVAEEYRKMKYTNNGRGPEKKKVDPSVFEQKEKVDPVAGLEAFVDIDGLMDTK